MKVCSEYDFRWYEHVLECAVENDHKNKIEGYDKRLRQGNRTLWLSVNQTLYLSSLQYQVPAVNYWQENEKEEEIPKLKMTRLENMEKDQVQIVQVSVGTPGRITKYVDKWLKNYI